jgi:hypothetical protein
MMPRFYVHTNNPIDGDVQDDEGFDFASVHEAKCQAVAYAGRLLCDVAEKFWDNADFKLTVTDESGLILFTMNVIGTEAPAIRQSSRPM